MGPSSARFRGDLRLANIHAGDTASFLRFGDSGPAIEAVQAALIDSGFAIPDGPTGFFGQQTANAVVAFKQAHGLFPDDPVAGVRTITTLDELFAAPQADRREWTESFGRAAEGPNPARDPRPFPGFNFSRFKELDRRNAGAGFGFDPAGLQLPPAFVAPFLDGIAALLDPGGSPNGTQTASASWGASPFDLYHVHLVVHPSDGATAGWSMIQNHFNGRVHTARSDLFAAAGASGFPERGPEWTAVYAGLLQAPVPRFGRTLAELTADWLGETHAESLATGHALHFLWHSFESLSGRWRPDGMASNDRRRSWWNLIAPVPGPVVQTPFGPEHVVSPHWMDLGQLGFVIDDAGVVTLLAPDVQEAGALRGIDMATVRFLD